MTDGVSDDATVTGTVGGEGVEGGMTMGGPEGVGDTEGVPVSRVNEAGGAFDNTDGASVDNTISVDNVEGALVDEGLVGHADGALVDDGVSNPGGMNPRFLCLCPSVEE